MKKRLSGTRGHCILMKRMCVRARLCICAHIHICIYGLAFPDVERLQWGRTILRTIASVYFGKKIGETGYTRSTECSGTYAEDSRAGARARARARARAWQCRAFVSSRIQSAWYDITSIPQGSYVRTTFESRFAGSEFAFKFKAPFLFER